MPLLGRPSLLQSSWRFVSTSSPLLHPPASTLSPHFWFSFKTGCQSVLTLNRIFLLIFSELSNTGACNQHHSITLDESMSLHKSYRILQSNLKSKIDLHYSLLACRESFVFYINYWQIISNFNFEMWNNVWSRSEGVTTDTTHGLGQTIKIKLSNFAEN